MSNFSISLVIGASVGGALAGIGQVKKSLQVLSDDSLTKGQRIGELFKMGAAGSSAVISSVTGIGTAIMAASQPAIQFESAMADVKKVVDFKSPEGFANLSKDILELSRSIPLTQTELAQIAASGGQLGVAEQDIKSFTETIAKMSTAFDMPAQQAGDSMAKLANVYKIPIDSIGNLGDAINTLSNNSPAKASEIVDTLGRVAGLAKPFGLTENQAAALSGTFIALGKSPEVAGTAINGMLTTLSTLDPKSKDTNAAFKSMGLDIVKFKEQVKTDGQGAIMSLLESIEKLPEADRIGILTEIFGKEYADDIAALSGGVGEYRKQLELLQETDASGKPKYLGSMEEEFKKRSETTANNMQLLKNNFNEVAITIGSVLLPVINDLIGWLRPMIEGFADWAGANQGLISGFVKVIAMVAAGFVGFNLLAAASSMVMTGFVGMAAVSNKAAVVLKFMTGQYGLLSTAMRLGLPVRKFIAFGHFMKGFGKGLFSPLIKGFGFLKSIPLNPLKALPMLFGAAKGAIFGIVGALKSFGLALLTTPAGWFAIVLAGAAILIYKYWKPIKAFFVGVWEGIKAAAEPIMPIFETIGNAIQPVLDWLGQFFNLTQVGEGNVRSLGQTVGGFLVWAFMKLTAPIRGAIAIAKWAWDTLSGLFKGEISVGDIFAGFSRAWEGFLTKIEGWKAKASELWNSFTSLFKGGGEKAVGSAVGGGAVGGAGGGGFWSSLTSGLESARQTISEKAGGLWDSAKAKFDEAKGTLTTKASEIWSSVTNVLNRENGVNIGAIIAQTVSGAVSAISGAATTIIGVLSAMVQGMSGAFVAIFPVISTAFSGMASVASAGMASLTAVVMAGFGVMRVQVASGWQSLGAAMSGNPMLVRLQMAMGQCIAYLGSVQRRFYAIGLNISQGLARGIESGIGRVRAATVKLAQEVDKTTRLQMKIKSPSRVMMALGGFVSAGLAVGIAKGGSKPIQAIGAVAKGVTAGFGEKMGDLSAVISTTTNAHRARMVGVGTGANGNITIHYQPTITADGQNRHGIEQLLKLSQREFEKMFQKMMQDKQRRSY